MADVTVTGLKELADAMRDLPTRIGRNVLRGATNAGASVIKKDAVARAPVYAGDDPRADPGRLHRALYQKQIRDQSNDLKQVFYVGVRSGKDQQKVKRGKKVSNLDAFYWRFVEFGTSKMSARPFLRPAFEAKKMEAVEAIKTYLAKRIPDEVAKLTGRS
jgi:HK97 gp10 family phage protein